MFSPNLAGILEKARDSGDPTLAPEPVVPEQPPTSGFSLPKEIKFGQPYPIPQYDGQQTLSEWASHAFSYKREHDLTPSRASGRIKQYFGIVKDTGTINAPISSQQAGVLIESQDPNRKVREDQVKEAVARTLSARQAYDQIQYGVDPSQSNPLYDQMYAPPVDGRNVPLEMDKNGSLAAGIASLLGVISGRLMPGDAASALGHPLELAKADRAERVKQLQLADQNDRMRAADMLKQLEHEADQRVGIDKTEAGANLRYANENEQNAKKDLARFDEMHSKGMTKLLHSMVSGASPGERQSSVEELNRLGYFGTNADYLHAWNSAGVESPLDIKRKAEAGKAAMLTKLLPEKFHENSRQFDAKQAQHEREFGINQDFKRADLSERMRHNKTTEFLLSRGVDIRQMLGDAQIANIESMIGDRGAGRNLDEAKLIQDGIKTNLNNAQDRYKILSDQMTKIQAAINKLTPGEDGYEEKLGTLTAELAAKTRARSGVSIEGEGYRKALKELGDRVAVPKGNAERNSAKLDLIKKLKYDVLSQFALSNDQVQQYSGAPRNIQGTNTPSLHNEGKALDIFGKQKNAQIAAWAINQGAKVVIFNRQVWTPARGWHPYSSAGDPHTDHVHVDFGR